MVRIVFVFLILILTNSLSQVSAESSFVVRLKTWPGEVDKPFYADTFFPVLSVNQNNVVEFRELMLERNYINSLINPPLFDLEQMILNLNDEIQCSVSDLGSHYNYFTYLYRLISLSYLYEAITDYQIKLNKLAPDAMCLKKLKPLLQNGCNATSIDLKDFIQTTLMMNSFDLTPEQLLTAKKLDATKLLVSYQQRATADISLERIRSYCEHISGSCDKLTEQELKVFLQKSCDEDISLFTLICNEKDSLLGLAEVPLAYQLLSTSNILNVIKDKDLASACLRRFSDISKRQQVKYYQLDKLFSVIHHLLVKSEPKKYAQGSIFVYGALKEFKEKGLFDILRDKNVKSKVATTKTKPTPVAKSNNDREIKIAENKIQVIEEKKEIIETKISEIMEVKPVEVVKSAFLEASELLDFSAHRLVWVDMVKFRFDFPFSFTQLKKYEEILSSYSTIKALEEMKKFDNIGTRSKPIPLSFVKYLIDTKKHHGLFNMIKVLGDEFYVFNDLDKSHQYKAHRIQPLNNHVTQLQWAILLLENVR
jgi:hypothetical protein